MQRVNQVNPKGRVDRFLAQLNPAYVSGDDDDEVVTVTKNNGVGIITIDNSPVNSFSPAVCAYIYLFLDVQQFASFYRFNNSHTLACILYGFSWLCLVITRSGERRPHQSLRQPGQRRFREGYCYYWARFDKKPIDMHKVPFVSSASLHTDREA